MNRVDQRELQVMTVLGICLLILCLTIAYALMSTKLSVNGSAKMESASWDIHFEDVSASSVGKATYTLPTISGRTVLTNFYISLKAPGDSVTFHFKVVNNGNLSAKLTSIVKSIPRCSGASQIDEELVCNNLIYKITEEDGTELKEGVPLPSHSSSYLSLTMGYPSTMDTVPEKTVSIENLDIDLLYSQD